MNRVPPLPDGRRGAALAVGLLLIVLVAFWFGIVSPLMGWYAARAGTLATSRVLERHMMAIAATLPALRKEAAHAARSGPPAGATLSGASDAVAAASLQVMIEAMARHCGARLSSTDILPSETKGLYRRITLHLAASGSYRVIVELVAAVTHASPQMVIDDLVLHGPAIRAPGAPQTIQAQFSVVAFRRAGAADDERAGQQAKAAR